MRANMPVALRPREIDGVPGAPRRISEEELRGWIESGQQRGVINVLMTPELARVCLEYNRQGETNRRLRGAGIQQLMTAMRGEMWINTGEPLIFSDQHWMNDGQYRLSAIALTGIPIVIDLRFGIDRRAFPATNSGRPRTGADALNFLSITNSNNVAATARLVLNYEAGLPKSAFRRVGNAEIVQALVRWPDIPASLAYTNKLTKPMRNAATQALAFFASRTGPEASVREFFSILETAEGSADAAPHRLNRFITREGASYNSSVRARIMAAGVIAWNAWNASPRQPLKGIAVNLVNMDFPEINGLKL